MEESSVVVGWSWRSAYIQIGMHLGDRMIAIGVALAGLVLAGYCWIPGAFPPVHGAGSAAAR
ncbi:MAG: hypothetical protein WDN69_08860 [Aliidongia sp.]